MVTKTTVSEVNLSITPTYINVLKIIPEKATSNVIDFINTDQFIEGFTESSSDTIVANDLAINFNDGNLYYIDIFTASVKAVTQANPLNVLFTIGENILQEPLSLAVDRRNNVVVYDTIPEKIFIINRDNIVLSETFSPGITDIVINENDDIICVNSDLHKVLIFDKFLHLKRQFGVFGSDTSQFLFPITVGVDEPDQFGTQNIIVGDEARGKVLVFSSNGNFLFEFGSAGLGDGQFEDIQALTVLSNRDIVVGDITRFQVFDSGGNFKFSVSITEWNSLVNTGTTLIGLHGFDTLKIYLPDIAATGNEATYKIYASAKNSPNFLDKDSDEWINLLSILDIEETPTNLYNHDFSSTLAVDARNYESFENKWTAVLVQMASALNTTIKIFYRGQT